VLVPRITRTYFGTAFVFIALPATADMVWPALYLETRIFTWWTIGVGLLVEFFFVRRLFDLNVRKAAIATATANAVSAVLGVPLIPIAGIIWELFPGSLYMGPLNWGTFNPITWGATFLLACFVTSVIEALVYKHGFKYRVSRRTFGWLILANSISVGVAFASLFVFPVRS
jgi:hypothetical protein